MAGWRHVQSRIPTTLLAFFMTLTVLQSAQAGTVAQTPLFLQEAHYPSVLFSMSVETPMGGAAYNDWNTSEVGFECTGRINDAGNITTSGSSWGACYTDERTYIGHFDPELCYGYKGENPALSIESFDSEETTGEGANNGRAHDAVDGDSSTFWHTQWNGISPPHPHYIQIDMGAAVEIKGLNYQPRQNGPTNGSIRDYIVYVTANPLTSTDFATLNSITGAISGLTPAASGTWMYPAGNERDTQTAGFSAVTGRYLTLIALSEKDNQAWTSAAEIAPIYTKPENYFEPKAWRTGDTCNSLWSGNFLNWATMTAMDAFIYTTTGGNRVVDTEDLTVVRRALAHLGNRSWFPWKRLINNRSIGGGDTSPSPSAVSPFNESEIRIKRTAYGFTVEDVSGNSLSHGGVSEFTVQVEVCTPDISGAPDADGDNDPDETTQFKDKCQIYEKGNKTYYKPEGIIQKNASTMRFGTIAYTRHAGNDVDGGVLRAPMKFVGPLAPEDDPNKPDTIISNSMAEFGTDGLLKCDPDGLATATHGESCEIKNDATDGVDYSGVINYINKFSDYGYKSNDPVSELFYEAVRYFKGFNSATNDYYNDADFSFVADSNNTADKGGFAIIDDWSAHDPIKHACQSNYIVAINDAYPWRDKRLPGTYFTSANFPIKCGSGGDYADDCGEPSGADTSINVTTLTNKVGNMEGLGKLGERLAPNNGSCTGSSCSNGRENTYYVAGLAYYANTEDLRGDFANYFNSDGHEIGQTVKTFMIDTQEYNPNPLVGQYNQLWLTGKYGGFVDSDGDKEPNLLSEWSSDGINPDNYVLASRPEKMVQGLENAFEDVLAGQGSASAVAVEANVLAAGNTVYQALFYANDWTGQLQSLTLTSDGNVEMKLDTDDEDQDGDTSDMVPKWAWRASDQLPAHGSRNIVTWDSDSSTGKAFEWSNLSVNQKAELLDQEDLLNYLRGDQTNEEGGNGTETYRHRDPDVKFGVKPNLLGDVVNSSPIYVKTSDFPYGRLTNAQGGGAYPAFVTTNANRQARVFVGANDGMLHAFNADTGVEEFAYIPGMVFSGLKDLAFSPYAHKYFVDGKLHRGDAYLNSTWKTVLLGSLGAGGRGIFALDITDNPNTSADDLGSNSIMWEFTNSDLGYVLGEVQVVLLNNGVWAAVFGNGYDSLSGKAGLYIKALDGTILDGSNDYIFIDTQTTANGLSEPLLVDTDGDLDLDFAYAGDLQGNMWKFDLTSDTPSGWEIDYGTAFTPEPLYTAVDRDGNPQVITSAPTIVRRDPPIPSDEPSEQFIIIFGTGKLFEDGDNIVPDDPQIETLYGILDREAAVTVDRTGLQEREIIFEGTVTVDAGEEGDGSTDTVDVVIRGISDDRPGADNDANDPTDDPMDFSTKSGWYLDLVVHGEQGKGERIINQPIISTDQLIVKTYIPPAKDDCDAVPFSWIMDLNPQTGARFPDAVLDINASGSVDSKDQVTVESARTNQDEVNLAPAGVRISGGVAELTVGTVSTTGELNRVLSTSIKGELEKVDFLGSEKDLGRRSWRQLR